MAKPERIVIIGGTACGPKAAARARRRDAAARITLIEQGEHLSTATCGLPYYISGVIEGEDKMVARKPDYFRDVLDMEVLLPARATRIDRQQRTVTVLDLQTDRETSVGYDRLVIATGSQPFVPPWEGKDLRGVFTLWSLREAEDIRRFISENKIKKVAVVGAGLIGLEAAENFVHMGLRVTLLEALGWPLPALLDYDLAAPLEKHLQEKGVDCRFGQRVSGFAGDNHGRVRGVLVGDDETEAGLVLIGIGVRPNVALAKEAGLEIGQTGGIAVNEFMQTSDPDIYAGGDCVENINRITGGRVLTPLGSTANKHGRIIGTNVTGGRDSFPGVLGTAIAKVFDYNAGRVGLTEAQAKEAGYDVVTSMIPAPEHAGYYPGGQEILVKLIADARSEKVLGGQVVGPGDADKRTDVLATALSFGATVTDVANLDLAYAPPYNSAMDPLHNAANVIRNKLAGMARTLTPQQVRDKLDNEDDFVLLDVRSPEEWRKSCIDAGQTKLVPLPELRQRLDELGKDAEIAVYCQTSVRAYQAQRILDGAGFKDTKFMDGSLSAWPYEVKAGKKSGGKKGG